MPRDIPVGNSRLLVTFDSSYRLRDFYFPHVGKENHSVGHPFRFGIWCDGEFHWTYDDGWTRRLDYEEDTLVTRVILRHEGLGIHLNCSDTVDYELNVYFRSVEVVNLKPHKREIKLFFHHDFHIAESEVGDTAMVRRDEQLIAIHYKANRYFLINGGTEDAWGIDSYATGVKELGDMQGTWRDAEDGRLEENPISQGSVDSTVCFRRDLPAHGHFTLYYWIAAATSYTQIRQLNETVIERGPDRLMRRSGNYWRFWVHKEQLDFYDLSAAAVDLFYRSLLILRTQIDEGGAIIAANDSDITQFGRDTYSYMWPRDGALVAHALDLAGYSAVAMPFYEFCGRVLTEKGFFLHKYNPDGTLGSSWHPWINAGEAQLPIQEDETGLVLWALWRHFEMARHVESIQPLYHSLIVPAGDFMAGFRDMATGLPLPSYDLWEERQGVFAFTVGAVHGGLVAAANFAESFGESDRAEKYRRAAREIRMGADRFLWSESLGRFARGLHRNEKGEITADYTIDSSLFGLFRFGLYDARDPRIASTMAAVKKALWIPTSVGGMARYTNDYYHRVSYDVTGNPWFVCTLWLAEYTIAQAITEADLQPAVEILQWVVEHALPSGVLAEQVHPFSNAPLSVSPLTWSHATYVMTVLEYLDRISSLQLCPQCGNPLFSKEGRRMRHEHSETSRLRVAQPQSRTKDEG
ncbi:MAG TPA: glycoside hydrolase family 15 protein [Armatimonadota bacterium]|nr:glycoside hydrolase family 15 protein [Armatimonadota bacterium]